MSDHKISRVLRDQQEAWSFLWSAQFNYQLNLGTLDYERVPQFHSYVGFFEFVRIFVFKTLGIMSTALASLEIRSRIIEWSVASSPRGNNVTETWIARTLALLYRSKGTDYPIHYSVCNGGKFYITNEALLKIWLLPIEYFAFREFRSPTHGCLNAKTNRWSKVLPWSTDHLASTH